MVVVCAGMPKAGSAWYFNLVDTLLMASGGRGAHDVRRRLAQETLLKGRNCAIANLSPTSVQALVTLARQGECFATKTHEPPSKALVQTLMDGRTKATYIYRDPRDAMISALEYGVRLRSLGIKDEVFTPTRTLVSIAQAYVSNLTLVWEQWRVMPSTHILKYEDLVADPVAEVLKTAEVLGLDVGVETSKDVVNEVAQVVGGGNRDQGVLHFNKGKVGRYREIMTAAEQRFCLDVFGPWLELMGYDTCMDARADVPGVALHLTALAIKERVPHPSPAMAP